MREAAAAIGQALDVCSDVERDVLVMEIGHADQPVDHGHRPAGKRRRDKSRCDVLRERHGGAWYGDRYDSVLASAWRKVHAELARRGLL